MAAVLSETITDSAYFPTMRRGGNERQRSPTHQQTSRPRAYVPASPRPRATDAIPQQISSATQQSSYAHGLDTCPAQETRHSFASQQNFLPPAQTGYHADEN